MSTTAGIYSNRTSRPAPPSTRPPARSPESFESLRRRNEAAEILQSYEKLSWYSFQRCESLSQTRLHFRNIIAGFTPADEEALVDWKEDLTPRPRPDSKTSRKGKERVSGVGAGELDSPGDHRVKQRDSLGGDGGEVDNARKKRRSVGGDRY